MSDHAVFFDPTRKRWWWIKRIGSVMGLMSVIVVSAWLVSLFTITLLPPIAGVSATVHRVLKKVNFPRHQTLLFQTLAKKDRQKLLREVAKEHKVAAVHAALPPIKAPNIVAAFYAPWQETGLHSLRANAEHMTHIMPAWVHLSADAQSLDFRDWDLTTTPHNNVRRFPKCSSM